jgi:hypothetical protein
VWLVASMLRGRVACAAAPSGVYRVCILLADGSVRAPFVS